jgi:hypothetical protein
MIIFGFRTLASILGFKTDECGNCGAIGKHLLVRKSYWFSLFFVPLILLSVEHGMSCGTCGQWTGVPMMTMLRGLRTGLLPLDRVRPKFAATEPDQWGMRPQVADVMDPIEKNPRPGFAALYVRVWPALVAIVVSAIVVSSLLFPSPPAPKTAGGQTIDTAMQDKCGPAHDCWEDGFSIVGCRLQNGEIQGDQIGSPKVCYFFEPLPNAEIALTCD